jgi:hypothetical protein
MRKKINVDQLKAGTFIHDFNCNWLAHLCFSNSTKVKCEKIIEKKLTVEFLKQMLMII